MPAVCRKGDLGTGHGCYKPRRNGQGSENVFVNGIPAHREGDYWPKHCCKRKFRRKKCHGSWLAKGSSTVLVNGKPIGRVGDPVACGSSVAEGSPNVFAGG